MEGKRTVKDFIKLKIRLFYKIARRKPLFLCKYLMRSLIVRAIVMSLYFLFFTLLPVSSITEILNGRIGNVIRDIPVKIQGLQFDTVLAFVKDIPSRIQAVQLDSVTRAVRALPTDINRVLANISTVISTRGKWLWEGIKSCWPPSRAKEKFADFAKKHLKQVKWITRAVLSFLLTMVFLKLLIIFIVPLLGLSALTILGIDLGVLVLLALQMAVTALSRFLGRILQGKFLAWYKRVDSMLVIKPVGEWAKDFRSEFIEQWRGRAKKYIGWLGKGVELRSDGAKLVENKILKQIKGLATDYLNWLNKAVYAKQGEYEEMMASLRGEKKGELFGSDIYDPYAAWFDPKPPTKTKQVKGDNG